MSQNTIAVVTGANKGIGFQIARKLCQHVKNGSVVYVGSRDVERGKQAVADLEKEYPGVPRLLELDVTDEHSVTKAAATLKARHVQVHILALNAGFAFKVADASPPSVQFPRTFAVNYFGVRRCFDHLMPLMSPTGRVVVTASVSGYMAFTRTSSENQQMLKDPAMTVQQLDQMAHRLIELSSHEGELEKAGFTTSAYGNSKLLVAKLAQIEAIKSKAKHPQLLINSCCPGWCKTDMAGYDKPPKTAEEGATTPFILATLPPESTVTGKFYCEGEDKTYYEM
eukprot:Protomagalhaensia_sp_Gyna_25__5161@NODE_609_length_3022_cov_136_816628_g471_i0_p2_GENE_NODE_609_length_3022_cov_136_816628_g471_i0NODE_609_length_3022_cov_136_816628_g471_i0_p2_ORF_typecomplete_len282_score50_29adh_short/PF00106_25/7_7e37adh_short_C2/PF13561_6/3_8e25KR/PF08659_10/1_6e08KR/PF08659_10/7_5e02Epimerase/PF01370_21/1_6e063Beta_HSD/PF01073_19/6_8e06Peripla_BP_4/PF13407_6/0_036RmlD_sub_bind/PF04321_17/0_61RmlD_sub_bind/PF04321_17/3_1e02_NODE_609_length_3022_cov_136_816628_g471_i06171462